MFRTVEGLRVTMCLVLNTEFGRKSEGKVERKRMLGKRRKQLPNEVNLLKPTGYVMHQPV
jgi:hypothetical protein